MSSVPKIALTRRRKFLAGILCYLALTVAVSIWAWRKYGDGEGCGVGLVLSIPLLISLRMYAEWHPRKIREFVFLLATVVAGAGAVLFVVGWWDSSGISRSGKAGQERIGMNMRLRGDQAFRNVKLEVTQGAPSKITGTVFLASDLERLKRMATECRYVRWEMHVEIADE